MAPPRNPSAKKTKSMRCKLTIRGGRMHHRRKDILGQVRFDRMITVEQAGRIIAYLAQFPEA